MEPKEQKEFSFLKRELLQIHNLNIVPICEPYKKKKKRYNELWDKNAKSFCKFMKSFMNQIRLSDNN